VESKGGAAAIQEKLKADFPYSAKDDGKTSQVLNRKPLQPQQSPQQQSQQEANIDDMLAMISQSNWKWIKAQHEITAENIKVMKEIANAQSKSTLFMIQKWEASHKNHQQSKELFCAIQGRRSELNALMKKKDRLELAMAKATATPADCNFSVGKMNDCNQLFRFTKLG